MKKITRRNVLKMSGAATLGLVTFPNGASANLKSEEKLKVVVVGAHPDDPETGCGGTMILLAEHGHEVISAYLTRGEAGISGKSHDEAAQIRTNEALNACKIMNAKAKFLSQIDGSTEITAERYTEMYDFINAEKPDIVFTHWPIDTHRDHRICSVLVYDAWLRSGKQFSLYYFEVMCGEQSQNFHPTDYVDISLSVDKKHKACLMHKSQGVEKWYETSHGRMEIFRGMEAGYKQAEAFIHQVQSPPKSIILKNI